MWSYSEPAGVEYPRNISSNSFTSNGTTVLGGASTFVSYSSSNCNDGFDASRGITSSETRDGEWYQDRTVSITMSTAGSFGETAYTESFAGGTSVTSKSSSFNGTSSVTFFTTSQSTATATATGTVNGTLCASTISSSEVYYAPSSYSTTISAIVHTVTTASYTYLVGSSTAYSSGLATTTSSSTKSWVSETFIPSTTTFIGESLYPVGYITNAIRTVYNPFDCYRIFTAGTVVEGYKDFCDVYETASGPVFQMFIPDTYTTETTYGSSSAVSSATRITAATEQKTLTTLSAGDGFAPNAVAVSLVGLAFYKPKPGYRPYTNLGKESPIYASYSINVASSASTDADRAIGAKFFHDNVTEIVAHSDDSLVMLSEIASSESMSLEFANAGGGHGWNSKDVSIIYPAGVFTEKRVDNFGGTSSDVFTVQSSETFSYDFGDGATSSIGRMEVAEEGVGYFWEYPNILIFGDSAAGGAQDSQIYMMERPCFGF